MKLTKDPTKIGDALKARGAVKAYRQTPGDFTAACVAARHYAEKNNSAMVVVPGNSYGNRVFHIARVDDSLDSYTAMQGTARVAVVEPCGDVFMATAE